MKKLRQTEDNDNLNDHQEIIFDCNLNYIEMSQFLHEYVFAKILDLKEPL